MPSGDQAPLIAGEASLRSRPDRMSRIHRSIGPSRSVAKSSIEPSGDHAGSVSTKTSLVSRSGVGWPPPAASTQRSPSAAKTTREPSGEIAGCVMPRTGCGPCGVKAWRLGVKAARVNATSAENSITRAGPPAAGRLLILPSAV